MTTVSAGLVLLIALLLPGRAAAQAATRDTASAATVKDLPLAAEERRAYVGSYAVTLPYGEAMGTARVFEEGGVLRLQPPGGEAVRLLYQGANAFVPEGMRSFVFVFELRDGRAARFTVRREDGVMTGLRVP